MTGHGEAQCQQNGTTVAVEVRTINNRYFKLSVRGGEGTSSLEPKIEGVVRKSIRRGTVQVSLKIDREFSPEDYRINEAVLRSYRQQLESLQDDSDKRAISLDALLTLPGVVDEQGTTRADLESEWPIIEQTVSDALNNLNSMRTDEGRAMGEDLAANCATIAAELDQIAERAPLVADGYRRRLEERLNNWLAEHDVKVEQSDLVREVGVFADRCDISEEIVRLRSHLEQFDTMMKADESNGRKLEFLTQEMFRETNTIGSKANDAEIARHVIEIKAAIERMREMIQNVE
jgi:uncharacterized protein (TIGR00255 family)